MIDATSSSHTTLSNLGRALTNWITIWKLHLFRGVLALILGIVAMLFPVSALFAFTLVFAAYLFVDGALALVMGLRKDSVQGERQRQWPFILYGILGLSIGIIFLIWPIWTTIAYAIATVSIVVVWAVAGGLLEIRAGLRAWHHTETGWLIVLLGTLSILLGTALMFFIWFFPPATLLSAAGLIGGYALTYGAILVVMAVHARRESRKEKNDELEPRPSGN